MAKSLRKLAHAIYRIFFFQKEKMKISLEIFDFLDIFAQNTFWVHIRTASLRQF